MRKRHYGRRSSSWSVGVKIVVTIIVTIFLVLVGMVVYVAAKWNKASYMSADMFQEIENNGAVQKIGVNNLDDGSAEVADIPDKYTISYDGKLYEYNENLVNILFLGIDVKGEIQEDVIEPHQADSLMLVTMDTVKKEVSVLSIPRDSVTDIQVYDIYNQYVDTIKSPIAISHSYGDQSSFSDELTVEAVSNLLYSLPIYRYAAVDMMAVADINDSVGGITLEILEDLTKKNPKMKKGETYTLLGNDATIYACWRDTTIDESPIGRMNRQNQYLKELFKQGKLKTKENVLFPVTVFESIEDKVSTNLSLDEITYLAKQIVENDMDITENASTVPGTMEHIEEGRFEDYPYPMGYIVDEEALKNMIIDKYYIEVTEDYY